MTEKQIKINIRMEQIRELQDKINKLYEEIYDVLDEQEHETMQELLKRHTDNGFESYLD